MRRDIQALRGIAVLLVLLYHFKLGPFQGGFLGVDIFFVISGYVITEKISQGTGPIGAQLHTFYLRRARRILPMSLLTLIVTSVATRLFLPPISYGRFFKDALAGFGLIPNINFALQQNNYLNQALDPSPLLHFWSLGVEEQFYFFWPLLFLFIFKARRRWIPILLGVATIFSMFYTLHYPIQSFYLPTSRAWEFLIGAALVGVKPVKATMATRWLVAIAGWSTMLVSAILISTSFATPGWSTIIPTVATGAVIWAATPMSEKLLLPKLGDYSYSLYLVHWPLIIIVLAKYPHVSAGVRALLMFVAIGLSFLVTNYFEKPIRFNPRFKAPLWQWGIAMLAGAGISTLVLGTAANAYSHQVKPITISTASPAIYNDGCHLPFSESMPKLNCIFGDSKSSTSVILAGDSHAAQWFPAMAKIAASNRWKLYSFTKSSCPATLLDIKRNGVLDKNCRTWESNLVSAINAIKPKYLFVSNFTEYQYAISGGTGDYSQKWGVGFTNFMQALSTSGTKIVLIGDTPTPPSDSVGCLSGHFKNLAACDFPLKHAPATGFTKSLVKDIGGVSVDPAPWLCTKGTCSAVTNGFNTYRDATHISLNTALFVIPQLQNALKNLGIK
ncbi:MAG: acyltransferase family protein [Actinomycetes bacterium]